ncbi:MAG: rhamnan synthesis F family protein, partial [Aquificaceae bacterium]|nr:rhamnan synthesis F family protein [Aquificaceae bacterium]
SEYVFYYLEKLLEAGIEIVFVSNSKLSKSDIERLLKIVRIVIVRKGRGRDFGSYFVGWEIAKRKLEIENFKGVLFCNDSVFGPIEYPNAKGFKEQIKTLFEKPFGGITDSWESAYHLQSYFITFSIDIVNAGLLDRFFKSYVFFSAKRRVIERYEIGLSQFLIREGIKPFASCAYFDVIAKKKAQQRLTQKQLYLNPTHFFWDILIEDMQCPFLKIELIRDNPSKIQNLSKFYKVISEKTNYPPELITSHLMLRRKTKHIR